MAERKKLLLRLDPEVYEAVARWAGDDLRSVNAQIEYALRLALRGAGRAPRAGRATSGGPGQLPAREPGQLPDREPGQLPDREPHRPPGPDAD